MFLNVKFLNKGSSLIEGIKQTDTVGDLKEKIAEIPGAPSPEDQKLLYGAQLLADDEAQLADLDIFDETCVMCVTKTKPPQPEDQQKKNNIGNPMEIDAQGQLLSVENKLGFLTAITGRLLKSLEDGKTKLTKMEEEANKGISRPVIPAPDVYRTLILGICLPDRLQQCIMHSSEMAEIKATPILFKDMNRPLRHFLTKEQTWMKNGNRRYRLLVYSPLIHNDQSSYACLMTLKSFVGEEIPMVYVMNSRM
jgi:hypothetical protein